MSMPGFPILSLIKKHSFVFKCKPYLPYIVSSERKCSIEDSGNKNDRNHKDENNTPEQGKSKEIPGVKIGSSAKGSKDKARDAAKKKLFSLLSELKIESNNKGATNLNLARAVKRMPKTERFKDILDKQPKSPDEEMKKAVVNVAESIGGDPKQTQSELKEKLSSLDLILKPPDDTDLKEDSRFEGKVDENIMSSVAEVAASVKEGSAPIRSQLTERLMRLHAESESSSAPKKSFETIVKDMRVETQQKADSADAEFPQRRQPNFPSQRTIANDMRAKTQQKTYSADVEFPERRQPRFLSQRPQAMRGDINIFQAPPLGIFSLDTAMQVEAKQTVWQRLEEKNLKLLVQFAPRNAFEEMIMWTEQGKHWKLPVDNQAEFGAEENVGFHEHVFLEPHLHGFPKKGPIRHFMELVIVGLSKNPYITVERKIENIDWFRNYFNEKADILKQCGALES